jgi:hypothetical protein
MLFSGRQSGLIYGTNGFIKGMRCSKKFDRWDDDKMEEVRLRFTDFLKVLLPHVMVPAVVQPAKHRVTNGKG